MPRPELRAPRAADVAPSAPAAPRPRERFCADAGATSDAELVALVLGTGVRGKSAVAVGEDVLAHCGGIAAASRATPHELARIPGVGPARAVRLAAAFALGRRALCRERMPGAPLIEAVDVYEYAWPRLAGLGHEIFLMLALDARHALIADFEVARGSLTGVEIHPREVFRPLIKVGAAAAVAVHNHPSGDPTPSTADLELTERLHAAGVLLAIPIIDHVVVADGGWISVAAWLAERLPLVPT
jgi:DNA repair protein RadC